MAKIAEKSPRYRSKKVICKDVAEIMASQSLHYGTKHVVLAQTVWAWSEFHGKYEGCPFWSEKALASDRIATEFIHEHAVPKSVIIKMLFDLKNPTPEKVEDILSSFCVGVVVTREEDRTLNQNGLRLKMPEDWDGDDRWARYQKVGIVPKKM
ncbi:hypothetical protein [Adhaeretor mobilis]|uniref:Uncharacterized protein n=1 Tax=Adhaeretor mobilis TaxID=1930276 RepID=A0A517MU38_9BACT|nr:hypothetical protein [Adhaeretor mobilis]QDS98398.1 hypothetical protein HG15A2_16740 [Adhaeretor mobilis]